MVWIFIASIDDCCEGDDGTVISGGLFETGRDAAELLEF